jgi:agmatinase
LTGGGISHYAGVNHGTFLHIAHEEGLVRNTSIHAGIRAPVMRPTKDVRNDLRCGFEMIKARDIDRLGIQGVIEKLKKRVADSKVYISVDIDVLDPAFAPATGTAEVGGWSTRELLTILDGLEGLEVVGADVGMCDTHERMNRRLTTSSVEVAPVYDTVGETTVLAAAEVALALIGLMVKKPILPSQ